MIGSRRNSSVLPGERSRPETIDRYQVSETDGDRPDGGRRGSQRVRRLVSETLVVYEI